MWYNFVGDVMGRNYGVKMQPIPVFPDITKIGYLWWKYADVSKTQGACHVIYVFFRSSFGKV